VSSEDVTCNSLGRIRRPNAEPLAERFDPSSSTNAAANQKQSHPAHEHLFRFVPSTRVTAYAQQHRVVLSIDATSSLASVDHDGEVPISKTYEA
jgi:hypothetical protein